MIKLVPDIIFGLALGVVFVKGHDVDNGLGISLLIGPRDAVLAQHPLPFGRKTLIRALVSMPTCLGIFNDIGQEKWRSVQLQLLGMLEMRNQPTRTVN